MGRKITTHPSWKIGEKMTYNFIEEYDIIVIGAGHAGVEAL